MRKKLAFNNAQNMYRPSFMYCVCVCHTPTPTHTHTYTHGSTWVYIDWWCVCWTGGIYNLASFSVQVSAVQQQHEHRQQRQQPRHPKRGGGGVGKNEQQSADPNRAEQPGARAHSRSRTRAFACTLPRDIGRLSRGDARCKRLEPPRFVQACLCVQFTELSRMEGGRGRGRENDFFGGHD